MNDRANVMQTIPHHGIPYARASQASHPTVLEIVLPSLLTTDHFLDIGCGRGAAIQWMLDHGFKRKITGIEIAPEIAEETRERFAGESKVNILCGDAYWMLPEDATGIYMFRPVEFIYALVLARRIREVVKDVTVLHFGDEGAAFMLDGGWDCWPHLIKFVYGHSDHGAVSRIATVYVARKRPC